MRDILIKLRVKIELSTVFNLLMKLFCIFILFTLPIALVSSWIEVFVSWVTGLYLLDMWFLKVI